mgnify:CR=1 FL=1
MPDRDWQAEIATLQARDRKARAILGVSETAGRREIRRAFRRASLRHHPDANANGEDSSRAFHLIRCAYKYLVEGTACAALDESDAPPGAVTDGKYHLENPWGYLCWWRESFFGV